jgi:hypothetical protein
MNKLLLALGILGTGGGAFLTVRQAAVRLGEEAQANRAAWQVQTQLLVAAQTEQARLTDRVRELRPALTRNQAPAGSPLWSELQTNAVGHFQPVLREHLLEELGFDWQISPDFIVIPKEALREFHLKAVQENRLADPVAVAFAMTPDERDSVETVMEQVRTEFKNWAAAHMEPTEPTNDVVAQYTLPSNRTLGLTLSNTLDAELVGALGQQRAELIRSAFNGWADGIGLYLRQPETLLLTRPMVSNEARLKWWVGRPRDVPFVAASDWRDLGTSSFPSKFLSVFPNGWADVAKRGGFELPEEAPPSSDKKDATK